MASMQASSDRNPPGVSGYDGLISVKRKFKTLLRQRPAKARSISEEKTRLGLTLLHSPAEPLIDFIFVHGLGGGSVKTWRKDDDPFKFWPKAWIPQEPELNHVRTSTFGYPADWLSWKDSILNIHDFGRKLLGDLVTSSYLTRDGDTSIVLIGHSMGGLVIKQAYLLAQQESRDIAHRIRCMFFFATPHRGSDSAELLKDIFSLSWLDRPYVSDLVKSSPLLQVINDEFRTCADPSLQLWSFYETLKTNMEMIVEKDSAILGLKNEEIVLMNADHRGICKFESREDPNYVTVRNAMALVTKRLLVGIAHDEDDEKGRQMQSIGSYLNVSAEPEADLEEQHALKIHNSCRWIERRETFLQWLEAKERNTEFPATTSGNSSTVPELTYSTRGQSCQIYWLSAKPGAGKSVCAAHVIMHLHELGHDCSYFFFKYGVQTKQDPSALFRSLAYQMALLHPSIRQAVQKLQDTNNNFDRDDDGTLWRKIFANAILKAKLERPQFWVIDALDECRGAGKLFPFLMKLECAFDLRIFITSRLTAELERGFSRLGLAVTKDHIESADTQADMKLYLSSHEAGLPVHDAKARGQLIDELLTKSNDSFLWLRVVRQELEEIYSEESIATVLEDIPMEMSPLYHRALEALSKNTREKRLTQALLIWSTCSVRPLSLAELQIALKVDAGLTVRELKRAVEGLCGSLLYVDQNDRVQMIHATARDFLLDPALDSEFAVRPERAHERIAKACLKYMEEEMHPPRSLSLGIRRAMLNPDRPVFADYASTAFSEHLAGSSPLSDSLMAAVSKFLGTNVLAWIEHVAAEHPNLYVLTRSAKNIKNYLERRTKYVLPLGRDFKMMDDWSTDLVRLVAKFGWNLKNHPSSIFFLIPSIAPKESRLHQQSLTGPRWLEIVGAAASAWDDCISFIEYQDSWTTALACGQNTFAIGMKSGKIALYDQSTCQEKLSLQHRALTDEKTSDQAPNSKHPNIIKLLAFDSSDDKLASASPQSICVWSLPGALLHIFAIQEPCVTLAFTVDGEHLLGATQSSRVLRLKLISDENETLHPPAANSRRLSTGNMNIHEKNLPRQAPVAAAISPDQTMLALLYRGQPIYLWSLEDNTLLGLCGRDAGAKSPNIPVQTALFNPNAESGLLAAAHEDGELAVFDAWAQREVVSVEGDAYSLASTPDGRTLASGNNHGTIRLWDFKTLTLLYCIRSGLDYVRSLAFSGDGSRLVDVRYSRVKVWEPTALIRRTVEDDANIGEAVSLHVPTIGDHEELASIAVMIADVTGRFIFAGRNDGTVVAYETRTGQLLTTLYSHRGDLWITSITCGPNLLVTADVAGRIRVSKVVTTDETVVATDSLLEVDVSEAVKQVLIGPDGHQLLVATASADFLFSIVDQHKIAEYKRPAADMASQRHWTTIAKHAAAVVGGGDKMQLHDWTSLEEGYSVDLEKSPSMAGDPLLNSLDDVTMDASEKHIIASSSFVSAGKSTTRLMVWKNPVVPGETHQSILPTAPMFCLLTKNVYAFLGVHADRLVFLDHEYWICSIDLDETRTTTSIYMKRHFFIAPDFMGGKSSPKPIMTSQGHIVFSREGQLAIIKGGLDRSF